MNIHFMKIKKLAVVLVRCCKKYYFLKHLRVWLRQSNDKKIESHHCSYINLNFLQFFVFRCLQLIHFTDILIKDKIFLKKNLKNWVRQKSSLFLYKSWSSTISLNICQSIHFTNILIKCKMFIEYKIF